MMYVWVVAAVILIILVIAIVEYGWLLPGRKGLPILMYHKISDEKTDDLTVPLSKLRTQFEYLRNKGFRTLDFKELDTLLNTGKSLPEKTIILTFDDAYRDFATHAFPLLSEFGFKATVFVPVGFMGKENIWDHGHDPVLSVEEIKKITQGETVEIGVHSFLHQSYAELDTTAMEHDLDQCFRTMSFHSIPYTRILAYPFGAFPKRDRILNSGMKEVFRESNVLFALRIGNRINTWPLKDRYEVKRIDIKGTDSFYTFRKKTTLGRRKMFS